MGEGKREIVELVSRFQSAQVGVDSCSGTNHEIFAEIFNLLHPVLAEYARSLTGDRDLAEDIVDETLMKLYQKADSVDPEKVVAWAKKVVLNSFRSMYRRERRYCSIDSIPESNLIHSIDPLPVQSRTEPVLEKVSVERALEGVSALERRIVDRLSRGDSVAEVAKLCGKHRVTIYRHMDSIKRKLVETLGGETVGEFKIPTAS